MPLLWRADGDGHLLWECTHPPMVHIRENPEFHGLVDGDKSTWPRCLLWHGWLHALAPGGGQRLLIVLSFIGWNVLWVPFRMGSVGSGLRVPSFLTVWLLLVISDRARDVHPQGQDTPTPAGGPQYFSFGVLSGDGHTLFM